MGGAGLGRGAHQRADNLQQACGVLAHADTQQLHQQPQRDAPPRRRAPLVICRPVPGRTEAAELGTCACPSGQAVTLTAGTCSALTCTSS